MPGHGNHWSALYGDNFDIQSIIERDVQDSKLIDSFACFDIANKTEQAEQVSCLRWGTGAVVEDILVVTDTSKQERFLFSGYPVLRDGNRHQVTIEQVDPWEYGIEGWIRVRVTTNEIALAFFDARYYAGSAALQPGETVELSLAGLAYMLEPSPQSSFEINQGLFWEMEKQRRLDEGASPEDAARPVTIVTAGMAAFLPRSGDECDEAEFQGVIESIEQFSYNGSPLYRLEIVVLRADDEAFKIPVFASQHALKGYIPRLGEDVRGVMWLQGYIAGKFGDEP